MMQWALVYNTRLDDCPKRENVINLVVILSIWNCLGRWTVQHLWALQD